MEIAQREIGNRWLTVDAAAQYLGCSRNFLDKDRITKLHGIPFTRLGRNIRYDRLQLDAFLEAGSCHMEENRNA